MLILVANMGSTSARFSLIDMDKNISLATGGVENIGTSISYFKYENFRGNKEKKDILISNYEETLTIMCKYLLDSNLGVIDSINEINIIGHRIVHGGEKFIEAIIIDDSVLNEIINLSTLAPLHNSNALKTIFSCKKIFPNINNIAVFDSAFHSTIPKENFMYAIPLDLYEKYKIRKYGFHGISYNYVLDRYSSIINKNENDINTIICHLGGGSSICAIKNGKSFDTTMEYTPLSGLIMVTRSGNVDPSTILAIMNAYNITAEEAIDILNNKSGYLAVADVKDAQSLVHRSLLGYEDAQLLRKMIENDFKRNLFSMMSNLGVVDSIIMTGGIGAKNKEQREMLLSDLEFFGIQLDKNKNNLLFNEEGIISSNNSKIPIFVIPTNEELEIAKQCKKVLEKGKKCE